MIQVVWESVVKAGAVDQFERAYGTQGPWTRLFRAYPGYQGTTLLRGIDNPRRYLTIDFWETPGHRKRMLTQARARYSTLDRAFADLTESEYEIGTFTTPTVATVRRKSNSRPGRPGGVSRRSRRTRS
jgi:heme-degrading monooxygenase HmoA